MAKLIAFSGGCYSGKTTIMEEIVKEIEHCETAGEIIRGVISESIDKVRADARGYLRLQFRIINSKIWDEWRHRLTNPCDLVLVDRSLADSMFYFTTYVNRSKLTLWDRVLYWGFLMYLKAMTWCAMTFLYSKVILFTPLPTNNCDDTFFRPEQLDNNEEYNGIADILRRYRATREKMIEVSVLDEGTFPYLVSFCRSII